MSQNPSPEEFEALKKQLEAREAEIAQKNQEIDELNSRAIPVSNSTTDNLLQSLIQNGGPLVSAYLGSKAEMDRYAMEKDLEFEKEELSMINKLDIREKIFKGILIAICVGALLISVMFFEKAEVIIPVLSLVIGLLFRSNSLSDFFAHAKRKIGKENED